MSFIDTILAQLAPHDCLGCAREGGLLCPDCSSSLPAAPRLTFVSKASLDSVRAAVLYQGLAKKLVWRLKSSGAQEAARVMASRMTFMLSGEKNCVLVSVPTATSRVRQRGYDQTYLVARALARQAGLPWTKCLIRMGQARQVGATRAERRRQLQLAFRVSQARFVRGAHIILIDDVITTGSTLEAAARVLKQSGAVRVDALAFAYTKAK